MKIFTLPGFASLAVMLTVAGLTLQSAPAAAVTGMADLADLPLANATTATILPNIFFILDDSGSMDWDYMPDHVNDSYCRNTSGGVQACRAGDPPYFSSAFNGAYYNPAVLYSPPKNADGSSKTSYGSPWTSVKKDGYNIQDTGTANLTNGYTERIWCTTSGGATCKSAIETSGGVNLTSTQAGTGNYIYPNATYKYLTTKTNVPAFYYTTTVQWCNGVTAGFGSGTCQSKKTSTFKYAKYGTFTRVNIVPATTSYTKGANRTDCAGATCTYAEEMTNFANWYAWYRTRMQMAKTAVGLAFNSLRGTPNSTDPLDVNYIHARVGFTTINDQNATDGAEFLHIDNFDTAQKASWYDKLYAQNPNDSTPLRGALMKAGKIYAGLLGTDPVQYSCQKNFAILSTDGYWNDSDTSAYGPKNLTGTNVGNQDGAAAKPLQDVLNKSNTLADVAYYYYNTDLRTTSCGSPDKCTNNVPPSGTDAVVDDVAQHQHMTTFTIGLGVDGTLTYQDGYKTSTSGDYYDIKQGSKVWPDPIANSGDQRIDDLWHAAVNGRGTYMSARDPSSLVNDLANSLSKMGLSSGGGAAAATSNLEPVSGSSNLIYIATYRTQYWDGELSAYTIDLSTNLLSSTATWQASGLLDSKVTAAGDVDSRTIYTWDAAGASHLKNFAWSGLTATEQTYFDNTKLSQYGTDWSATDKAAATGDTLLKYLRGQNRNEDQDRAVAFGAYYRLYRDRAHILGDVVHSQPIHVSSPRFNFTDTGYSDYKTAQATRTGMIYLAANDGMLHAFNAATGQENWAYVSPLVMPNLYRLADKTYDNNHRFYNDGTMTVSDINVGGSWKTVLLMAYGKGGRGYSAIDVTDPSSPKAMWNFTASNDADMGYSYGIPVMTKLADGTWVALLTSGYNNVAEGSSYPGGTGRGYVFVVNAADGTLIRKIDTGEGSIATPSGLARIAVQVNNFDVDNTTIKAYGGDLLGNMWRFDLEAGIATKLMALGDTKPISTAPDIGMIDGSVVVMFGTGRYIGEDDLTGTALTAQQGIYAVRDDGSTLVTSASLVQQTLTDAGTTRTASASTVDWTTGYGWYINLPDSGERVNVEPQLVYGTLLIASLVPTATACQPGGYGYINFLDYKTGGQVAGTNYASMRSTSPYVGITVTRNPNGTLVGYGVTADGQKPSPFSVPISATSSAFDYGRRVQWRELFTD